MGKLGGPTPTNRMESGTLKRITAGLFPTRPECTYVRNCTAEPPPLLTHEELRHGILRIQSRNKSPGPDGISSAILVAVYQAYPDWLMSIFNCCISAGIFPRRWKTARLVLLRKGDKPIEEASSYRPLCLLNDVGKLLEFLIVRRLETQVAAGGGLSAAQYGFRRGLPTVDVAIALRNTARTAMNRKDMCVAVALDIRNAFNSVGWDHIMQALTYWKVQPYLRNLLQSYFHEHAVVATCPGAIEGRLLIAVSCGVPQGSVVGPLLWNMTYDQVLRVSLPTGVSLIGFADDTLVIANGKTSHMVEDRVNAALLSVSEKISALDLTLATEKTEAVMFRRKYKDDIPRITLNGTVIDTKRSIKHLGIIVDDNLSYNEHVEIAARKAQKVLTSLCRIMPNIGGPKEPRRKLLVSVVHSVILYGAPVWGPDLQYSKSRVDKLMRIQRRAALRSSCAYRSVSYAAANIIVAIPPIDLLVDERTDAHWLRKNAAELPMIVNTDPMALRNRTLERWVARLVTETKGAWTRSLIKDVPAWCSRTKVVLSFHLTQMLSGHGCFGKYLCRIKKEETPKCHHCGGAEDDAHHTLFMCPSWSQERGDAIRVLETFEQHSMVELMMQSPDNWDAVSRFCSQVLASKEEEESYRRGELARPS